MRFLFLFIFWFASVHAGTSTLFIPFGTEKGQLGFHKERLSLNSFGEEVEQVFGPISFYVDQRHRSYFLDLYKGVISRFDSDGKYDGEVPLPFQKDRESSFEDFIVLPNFDLVLLDSLNERLIRLKRTKKGYTKSVVGKYSRKDQDPLLFQSLAYFHKKIISKDQNSGQYYQLGREAKRIDPGQFDEAFFLTAFLAPDQGNLAYQLNQKDLKTFEFYSLKASKATSIFDFTPGFGADEIEVLGTSKGGLSLASIYHSETESHFQNLFLLNWRGELQNKVALKVPVVSYPIARNIQHRNGFLYILWSDPRQKGMVLSRFSLRKKSTLKK